MSRCNISRFEIFRCEMPRYKKPFTVALGAIVAFAVSAAAIAQPRVFPNNTLRGELSFGEYPAVTLNGKAVTLTPGSRVRNTENLIVPAASLTGAKWLVHYTVELGGEQVRDIWLLTPEEAAIRPWPTTPEQAASWTFDTTTMTWSRP